MVFKFSIDLEKINEANGAKTEALFKYLKATSKNKTPIVLEGKKSGDFWDCNVYECAVPASHFTSIKLPAGSDANSDGAEMYALLGEKLLGQFIPGAEFVFKENEVNVKCRGTKARDSYKQPESQLKSQLEGFAEVLNADVSNSKIKLEIENGSEITGILKEIGSSPDATIFINQDSITLQKDTVLFRTKNHETFTSQGEDLFINMYLANKILSILDYSAKVEVYQTETHTVVIGYDENGAEIVKNVSSVFEATAENPSDEDLSSITPDESASTVIDVELETLMNEIKDSMNMISAFVPNAAKKLEVKFYKNGSGLSLGLETDSSAADKSVVTINVGDVAEEEVEADKFTGFAAILPKSTIETLMKDNLNLKIVFDDSEDTTVLFESGDYKILSGKLID